jgi:hypothetical protein
LRLITAFLRIIDKTPKSIMKKLIATLLLMIPLATMAQRVECRRFSTGNFKLIEAANISIERTRSKQIETYHDMNHAKVEFKLEWLDDCRFRLSEPKTTNTDLQAALVKSKPITITIINTWDAGYKYRFEIEGTTQVLEFSATKVQ